MFLLAKLHKSQTKQTLMLKKKHFKLSILSLKYNKIQTDFLNALKTFFPSLCATTIHDIMLYIYIVHSF